MIGIFKKPVVALWPFMIVMCYFNGVKFGPIPVALLAIVVGSLVAWMSGEMSSDNVGESASNVGFGLSFPLADIFSNLDSIQPYISIIIPVSITNFLGTIECTESAALAGDHYPLGESMRADGLGSIVGALFGSPFGTTVYIGHAAYKQMGGRRGYSLLNGAVCCFAFLTALAAPVFSIIAREAVEPVIVFVGLMIACQTVEISNKRYYPAFFLGLVPPLCDFAMTKINDAAESYGRYADDCLKRFPVSNDTKDCLTGTSDSDILGTSQSLRFDGIVSLGSGALLTSLLICCMLVYFIDRNFKYFSASSVIAALFSPLWSHTFNRNSLACRQR